MMDQLLNDALVTLGRESSSAVGLLPWECGFAVNVLGTSETLGTSMGSILSHVAPQFRMVSKEVPRVEHSARIVPLTKAGGLFTRSVRSPKFDWSWQHAEDERRSRAIMLWQICIDEFEGSCRIAQQLDGEDDVSRRQIMADSFRGSRTNTLMARGGALVMYIRWAHTVIPLLALSADKTVMPVSEELAY